MNNERFILINAYPDSCRRKVEYTRENFDPTTTLFFA